MGLYFEEHPRDGKDNSLIENKGEMHLPCVVLVDTSGSMSGSTEQLHNGLVELGEALDEQAKGRVEFCIVAFDDKARIVQPFGPAYDYVAPELSCGGMTAMHEAVDFALGELEARKSQYKENCVSYYRPWIFLLTDGGATDSDNGAFGRLIQSQRDKHCTFFSVGIGNGVDWSLLKSLNIDGKTLKASKENFEGAFVWLSNSLTKVSSSNPGTRVGLENPQDYQISVLS